MNPKQLYKTANSLSSPPRQKNVLFHCTKKVKLCKIAALRQALSDFVKVIFDFVKVKTVVLKKTNYYAIIISEWLLYA